MNILISIILLFFVDISGIILGLVIGYIVGKKEHTQIQKGKS